jgi:hypothetical protein
MSVEQTNDFLAGLDLESDLRDVDAGFYTYLLNGTTNSTFARNKGTAESVASNVKITRFWSYITKTYIDFELPTGVNKCIAVCKDLRNDAIIFFNYNSLGNHCIYRYWPKPAGIEPFIETLTYFLKTAGGFNTWGNILNFSEENKIYNARIMETGELMEDWENILPEHPVFGNSIPVQYLWFTDGVNPQRRYNLSDLYYIADNNFTFDQYWINVAKQAPQKSPGIQLQYNLNRVSNFLSYKHFQFRVRYKYKDGEFSSLSPISDISLLTKPDILGVAFDRPVYGANPENNEILVFNNEINSIHQTVVEIEFYYRNGNGSSSTGTTDPNWYRFFIAKRDQGYFTDSNYFAYFYGNEATTPISNVETDRLFYTAPLVARHQEIVDDNQVVFLDITEGQDRVNTIAEVTYVKEEFQTPYFPKQIITPFALYGSDGKLQYSFGEYNSAVGAANLRPGDVLSGTVSEWPYPFQIIRPIAPFIYVYNTLNIPYTYTITFADIGDVNLFIDNLCAALLEQTGYTFFRTGGNKIAANPKNGKILIFADEIRAMNGTIYSDQPGFARSPTDLQRGFKEGCTHKTGIIHYDKEMRQGAFEPFPDIYIPFITETYPRDDSYNQVAETYGLNFKINTPPPSWASYYKIVHKGQIQKTAYYSVTRMFYNDTTGLLELVLESYDTFTIGAPASASSSGFNAHNRGIADFPKTDWKNCKIRFLTEAIQEDQTPNSVRTVIGGYIQCQITDVFIQKVDNTKDVTAVYISDFGYPKYNIGPGSLVEIYLENYDPVYFELPLIGESNEPLGKIVEVDGIRQYDFGTDVTTYYGDVYKRFRAMQAYRERANKPFPWYIYFIESFSISDWWYSEYTGKGRVQVETPNMKKQRLTTMLRWTGRLLQNTLVNNTNVFDEGNYEILSTRFGDIVGARQVGYVLKVIMWNNTPSLYIKRREIQSLDGSTQLSVTDNLIGTVNYSEQPYGSKHPGSVIAIERSVYFYDVINRCFVRNDPNGSDNLSLRKAQRFWVNLSENIAAENMDVITGYDSAMGLIYVTARDNNGNGDKTITISYSEAKNYWNGFHTFSKSIEGVTIPIDIMGNIGSEMACFLNGEVWAMNKGTDFLNLFGSSVLFKAGAATNMSKSKIKMFMNHIVRANRRLNKSTQSIPDTDTNTPGMASYIPGAKYIYKEGVYYSDTNKNINTFGVPQNLQQELNGLVQGQSLRGHVCDTIVEFDGNEQVILKSIGMGVIPSEKS